MESIGSQEKPGPKRTLDCGTSDFQSLHYDSRDSIRSRPVDLIEDLAQHINASYNQCYIDLAYKIDQTDLEKLYITTAPFEEGVKALQNCFSDILPSTFREVFPLLLFASIAVNKLWHSLKAGFQNSFFKDVREWHCAIPNLKDKELFFKWVDCLFARHISPEDPQWQANYGHYHSTSLTQVGQSEEPAQLTSYTDHSTCQDGFAEEHSTTLLLPEKISNLELLHRLKKGSVLTVCARYLNRRYCSGFGMLLGC